MLCQAVSGISNVILSHGPNDINLDFADVKTVMSHRGLALMGSGSSTGANAAYDAAKVAIDSPLLDNISINGAKGVLVHFQIHPDYPILQISEAMDIIEEHADEDASVIFGTTTNSSIELDEVKITIIATGFESQEAFASDNTQSEKVQKVSDLLSGQTNANGMATGPRHVQHGRKVVGGYNGSDEEILDVPTFLRKQMD